MNIDNKFLAELNKTTAPEDFADLMRHAENIHIDNLNGRDTEYTLTGDQLKGLVIDRVQKVLGTKSTEYEEFVDICNSMGI